MSKQAVEPSRQIARRIIGTSLLRAYALVKEVPTKIKYSDHPVRFKGYVAEEVGRGLAWGIYGTNSINLASSLVSMDAKNTSRTAYFLDLNYAINQDNSITAHSPGTVRDEVVVWLKRYSSRMKYPGWEKIQEMSDMIEILRQFPMLAHAYMNNHKEIDAMGYEVALPSKDDNLGLILQIVLFRKKLDNVLALTVRYHQDIEVLL